MKYCTKCKQNLEESLFYKRSDTKCGLNSHCINCIKETKQNPKLLNKIKEKHKEVWEFRKLNNIFSKICNKCNLDLLFNEYSKLYKSVDGLNPTCRTCVSKYNNSPRQKELMAKRIEKYKASGKYQETMKRNNSKESYRIKDRVRGKTEHRRNWVRNRMKNSISLQLAHTISSGIRHSLIRNNLSKNRQCWEDLVDFTLDELKVHLESKFRDGMNWNNKGRKGWHIDHIRPISSFNITSKDCEDFKKCWALENLQPLWEHENLSKNDKWEPSTCTYTFTGQTNI